MNFDPSTSLFAGLDEATLRAALLQAQTAMIALTTGEKEASVEVTGGGQHRAVTFTQTDMAKLTNLIRMLQAQLGIISTPRSRARISF